MAKEYKLIFLFIIASLGFYNPSQMLSGSVQKLIFYIVATICFLIACLRYSPKRNTPIPKYYYLIIAGIILSSFVCTEYHDQSLSLSFQASLYRLFAYAFLFILFSFNLPIEKIEKILVIMGLIGIIVNGINMLTAPNCFFGSQQEDLDVSRGFVRVRTPIIYIVFLFFYALSKFKLEKKYKWLLVSLLSYAFIVFWVARQYIFFAAILGLLFYISNIKLYKKIILLIVAIAVFEFVILNIPFVQNLIDMSKSQQADISSDDDIRIIAWDFYTNSYQVNWMTRIFGNGVPSMGNSPWGIEFENLTRYLKVYPSDVGYAGFYFYHGIIALAGLVILFIKGILCKKNKDYGYINYVLFLFVLTNFAGGSIIMPEEVTALMCFFYIAYKAHNTKTCVSKNKLI